TGDRQLSRDCPRRCQESPIEEILQQAIEHHQAGRLAAAEGLYREVLRRRPGDAVALNLLGVLAAQTGHPLHALTLLRASVEADANAADAYNNLARALIDLGRAPEAIEA